MPVKPLDTSKLVLVVGAPTVQHVVASMVENMNCVVLRAADNRSALQMAETRPEALNMIITAGSDSTLSVETMQESLSFSHPETMIVCTSARAAQGGARLPVGVRTLPHPFGMSALRSVLGEWLGVGTVAQPIQPSFIRPSQAW